MTQYVLLTGPGCAPCNMLKKRLEAEGLLEDIIIFSIDSGSGTAMARTLGIKSVPALVRDGTKDFILGASHPMTKYKEFLEV